MTGNDDHLASGVSATTTAAVTTSAPTSWLSRFTDALAHRPVRYLAVDGGSGTQVLAALAGQSPHLRAVSTPRHADLLIVAGPINERLAPAVAELARALPHPARALALDAPNPSPSVSFAGQVPIERILPNITHVPANADAAVAAALHPEALPHLTVSDAFTIEPQTIATPPANEREIATELAALSLGPLQPFTAGPLRLWLVCDGEQVLSCQVEAGYAARGVAEAMLRADWQAGAALARQLDPLAPNSGQLAYAQAIESLQGVTLSQAITAARAAALALESATNFLWWATRFFRLLDAPTLAERAAPLAATLADLAPRFWPEPPARWLAPQMDAPPADAPTLREIARLAEQVDAFTRHVRSHRLLRLRTADIGRLPGQQQLLDAHVTGPTLFARMRGAGDVQSRLLARLELAATRLSFAAKIVTVNHPEPGEQNRRVANWEAPPGEASANISGPRGQVGLRLASDGGERPTLVEWRRPSAAALSLLPGALAGQKLADAEVIVASLDLAMAEADG